MTNHWINRELGNVAEIITGNTPSKKNPDYYNEADIPWAKIVDLGKGLVNDTAEYLSQLGAKNARIVPTNAVMVSCVGTIGKVGIAGRPMATNQQINSIVFDSRVILPKFGYYFMVSIQDELKRISSSSVISIINKTNLSKIVVPIPTLEEQNYIISLLEKCEAILREKRYLKGRFETYLSSLFISVFGDPAENTHDGEFGLLCDYLTESLQNGIYKSHDFYGQGYPIIRVENMNDMIVNNSNDLKKVELDKAELEKYHLKIGNILINRINSISHLGKCTLVKNIEEPTVYESNIVKISVDTSKIHPEFLVIWLSMPHIKSYIQGRAKKSISQASINQQDILDIPVPLVPFEDQVKFISLANKYTTLKGYLKMSNEKIELLYEHMLRQAFNGDLSATWRAKHGIAGLPEENKNLSTKDESKKINTQVKSRMRYFEDTHCIVISNKEYLSRDGVGPIEVSLEVLRGLRLEDIPVGVSIRPIEEIRSSLSQDYGKLEYLTIKKENNNLNYLEYYLPYENGANNQHVANSNVPSILSEYGDFRYFLERQELKNKNSKSLIEIINIANTELKERGRFYSRYDKIPVPLKQFINSLSLSQQAMYEEFLLSPNSLAIHMVLKRLKLRSGIKKLSYSIQDAVQTIKLLEDFGILEQVPPQKMFYPRSINTEANREIQLANNEALLINLWQWSGVS